MVTRARVIPAADAAKRLVALGAPGHPHGASRTQWRRIVREEVEGQLRAEVIVQDAHAQAEAIVVRAREEAALAVRVAAQQAGEEAQTAAIAQWIAVRSDEQRRIEGQRDQMVTLAVALAERLLGESLVLEPARVVELARGVIAEARGARRARIDAHPIDAAVLREHLAALRLDAEAVQIHDDAALARGELRLHTDIGTIDARLAPRFERLAAALRDALQ
jgi:flagellar assembly protein FliH